MKKIVDRKKKAFDVYCEKGLALRAEGKPSEAVPLYQKALELFPLAIKAKNYLGNALMASGRLIDAIGVFNEAVDIDSSVGVVRTNRALARFKLSQVCLDEARDDLIRLIDSGVGQAAEVMLLANIYYSKGQYIEALGYYKTIVKHDSLPERLAIALGNMGYIYQVRHCSEKAIAAYVRSIKIYPQNPEPYRNLARLLCDEGRMAEAAEVYRTGIARFMDNAELKLELSLIELRMGNFVEGFKLYESRYNFHGSPLARRTVSGSTTWDGEADLSGKSLLLFAEQGFGDSIQMLRYLSMFAECGARVSVECRKELHTLFSAIDCAWLDKIYIKGDVLPSFDFSCSIMSMPLLFKTLPSSIPPAGNFLINAVRDAGSFSGEKRLNELRRKGLLVGICWQGSMTNLTDSVRSLELEEMRALFDVKGASFVSLVPDSDTEFVAHGASNVSIQYKLSDFLKTAQVVSQLDLVITCDTAIAHLAGALGKPVWILVASTPDWRWMLDREDSLWYESARLFRQGRGEDWCKVIARVSQRLTNVVGGAPPVWTIDHESCDGF